MDINIIFVYFQKWYHRIMESQNDWVGKGPQEVIWSNVPAQVRPPTASSPGQCPVSFWTLLETFLLLQLRRHLSSLSQGCFAGSCSTRCTAEPSGPSLPRCFASLCWFFAHFLVELSCWETCCPISPACCGLLDGSTTLWQIRQSQFCIPSTLIKGTLLHHSDNDVRIPFQTNSNIIDIAQLSSWSEIYKILHKMLEAMEPPKSWVAPVLTTWTLVLMEHFFYIYKY